MLGCFSRQNKRPCSESTPLPLPISDSAPSTSTSISATSSSNSILFKNFNSLYDPQPTDDSETLNPTSPSPTTTTTDDDDVSPKDDVKDDVDLCSAIASRRFFPACPGRSKSIVDSAAVSVYGIGSGVAVPTYSADPYNDFKKSMEEMVVALGLDERAHWARLHELLLCYLALNSKQTHKYIISAFADLLLGLNGSKEES